MAAQPVQRFERHKLHRPRRASFEHYRKRDLHYNEERHFFSDRRADGFVGAAEFIQSEHAFAGTNVFFPALPDLPDGKQEKYFKFKDCKNSHPKVHSILQRKRERTRQLVNETLGRFHQGRQVGRFRMDCGNNKHKPEMQFSTSKKLPAVV